MTSETSSSRSNTRNDVYLSQIQTSDAITPAAEMTRPQVGSVYDDKGSITGDIAHEGHTDDTMPLIRGAGVPAGALVIVYDNGAEIGRVYAEESGEWAFAVQSPLAQGRHAITIEYEENGQLSGRSEEHVFYLDDQAPNKPIITAVIDDEGVLTGNVTHNGRTDDSRPQIEGTAEAGATVRVYDGAKLLGETVANASGNWSFTPSTDLADGKHYLLVEALDEVGNSSGKTTPYIITVDTAAPNVPAITAVLDNVGEITGNLANNGTTDDARPELKGTAEAGSTVSIYDGGTLLGQTTADASGSWSFTPASDLDNGAHSFTADARDEAGNTSGKSAAWTVTINTTAPTVSITHGYDDVGGTQGTFVSGTTVDDATPTLHGKATAGGTVKIYEGTTLKGSVTADASGNWSFTLPALSNGHHGFTATVTTAAAGESAKTTVFNVTVDTVAPTTPSITYTTENAGPVTGKFAPGATIDDDTPYFQGRAEAGATVNVYDHMQTLLGSVVTDADGIWRLTLPSLSDGLHNVSVRAVDAAGNVSSWSNNVQFTVNTSVPTVSITHGYDDVGGAQGTFVSGTTVDDATPTLHGKATAGGTVKIYEGTTLKGSVTADASGNWSYTLPTLSNGLHSFTATVTTPAAGESAKTAVFNVNVQVDITAPNVPVITSVLDDVGAVTGNVANNGTTDDARPELKGTAEAGSTVSIYDGGTLLGQTTADASGSWSFTPASDLDNGAHSFTADARDEAGNTSGKSAAWTVTINTTAPTVSITHGYDDVGGAQGTFVSGTTVDDATPTLHGKATAGGTVKIYEGTTLKGSVTADASGNWSYTLPTLSNGLHSFTATVTTPAAGESAKTAVFNVNVQVDITAPNVPVITSVLDDVGAITGNVANNGTTDDARPQLKGTAEAGSTVRIYDGATLLGQTTADGSGNWSFTPSSDLGNGAHSFTADARDEAGNTSGKSAAWTVTINTTAPTVSITHGYDDVGGTQGTFVSGTTVDDATPTLHGKATAGGTVKIYEGTTLKGSVTADASGNWSFTLPALSNGHHGFTATVTTAAAGESAKTTVFNVTVDTVAPTTPSITYTTENAGPVTGKFAPGATIDDDTPYFQGRAEAGATVNVYDHMQTLLGSVVTDADGIWRLTLPSLSDGLHNVSVRAVDAAGNVSSWSNNVQFTVNTSVPTVSITHGYDDVGGAQGTFVSGTTVDDATPTLHGKATAGGTVKIYEGTTLKGSVTADASGNWSYTLPTLSNGLHSFTATVTTPAAGESAKTAVFNVNVQVDITAPNVPVITSVLDDVGAITGNVANNGTTDDARPQLKGTAEAGSTVRIYDGATLLGQTTADGSGNWSFTPSSDLGNGAHSFTADARDEAGNTSGKSAAWTVTINTTAPTVSITHGYDDVGGAQGTFVSGTTVDDATPTLHGKATAGGTVKIYEGTTLKGSVMADASGNWSYTLPALSNGLHSFTATVTTPAAGESAKTAVFNVNVQVDTTAPNAPTIISVLDNVGAVTGNVANNGTTDDARPELKGTAEAGSTVRIYDGASLLGQTTADGSGNWSFTPSSDLGNGAHSFTAEARDAAGNTSGKSAAWTVTINTTAPTVSITHGYDDVGGAQGTFVSGTTVDDATPTLHGKATAGGTVKIYEGTTLKGSVMADASGNWSYTLPALSNGLHSFTATVTTPAAGESAKTAVFNVNVQVDITAPNVPVITSVLDDVGAITGNVANNGTTDDARPQLKGTAEAGSTVRIYDGATLLGQTTADGSGNWSFTPSSDLGNGAHSFTADARDEAGNTSGKSAAWTVTINTTAPTVSITHGYDDVLATTAIGNFLSGDTVDDATPTLHGKATAGGTVKIYEGTTLKGSVTADASGNWSYTLPALSNGLHSFTATVTTPAAGESAKTAVFNVNVQVDTTAPNAPTIISVLDNVGAVTGNVANNGTTDDARPELKGTAEAGSTVRIYDGASLLGQTTADGSGNWSFTPSSDLGNGAHSFTAEARDAAGNTSGKSAAWTVTINTTAPTVSITHGYDDVGGAQGTFVSGTTVDDATPTLHGKATAGGTVKIYEGTTLKGSVMADASGNWSYTLPALSNGLHSFTATVTTPAAGESAKTAAFNINIAAFSKMIVDFEEIGSYDAHYLSTGESYSLGGLTFTSVADNGGWGGRPYAYPSGVLGRDVWTAEDVPANSDALHIAGKMKISLPAGKVANSVKFNAGDVNNGFTLLLLDQAGNVVHKEVYGAFPGTKGVVDIDLSSTGKTFSSFQIHTEYNYGQNGSDVIWVDNIELNVSAVTSTSLLFSAPSLDCNDTFNVLDASDITGMLTGGEGTDTLKLVGSGAMLDLTALGDKLSSIEVIDLTGTGNNALKLSVSDVLEQGGKDLFRVSGEVQMMVNGNAGDTVNLDDLLGNGMDVGDWAKGSSVTVDGVTYVSYQHSGLDAELLVQSGVTVNLV
ncbi:Ig-like domain-containing protein [Pseudomonas sp. QL9]|uniref:Ig-like domain-containing protein n=1 Tax=Pseudomonas sp. QL9 TaxID=3242725 RepID=UPI00352B6792